MTRRFALSASIFIVILFSLSCSKKTPSLNLLVWEGYADPSFIHGFEEQYHCKVSASYMGSSDELVAKLRGGSAGNYDVISPSSDVATSIAAAGLALPSISRSFPITANSRLNSLPCCWSRERTGLWRTVHVGARSADLRHHGFPGSS